VVGGGRRGCSHDAVLVQVAAEGVARDQGDVPQVGKRALVAPERAGQVSQSGALAEADDAREARAVRRALGSVGGADDAQRVGHALEDSRPAATASDSPPRSGRLWRRRHNTRKRTCLDGERAVEEREANVAAESFAGSSHLMSHRRSTHAEAVQAHDRERPRWIARTSSGKALALLRHWSWSLTLAAWMWLMHEVGAPGGALSKEKDESRMSASDVSSVPIVTNQSHPSSQISACTDPESQGARHTRILCRSQPCSSLSRASAASTSAFNLNVPPPCARAF